MGAKARAAIHARLRRFEAVGLALVLLSTLLLPAAEGALANDVAADANWIMSARFSDGAIANYVDRQSVWPYLSNFAAMGLARATAVTRDPSYVAAAWQWLTWYQAHQNTQGYVTDYRVVSNVLTSTNDMDSTDSYAGTFLLAVRDAYKVTSDQTRLQQLAPGIEGAVRAIESTQDVDGLTWAKPTWHVKYLMDQAETYAGLLAAVDLANNMKNSSLAQQAAGDANRMKVGVAKLWNATTASFDWAVHGSGAREPTNWSILYSDSLQQAWAVAFGIVEPTLSPTLVTKFNTAQPNWQLPAATAQFSGGTSTVGYWPCAGLAFQLVGSTLTPTAVANIRTGSINANRAWPFTTGNAGQLILFETGYTLPLSAAPVAAPPPTTTATFRGAPQSRPPSTGVRRAIPGIVSPSTTAPSKSPGAPSPPTTAKPVPTTVVGGGVSTNPPGATVGSPAGTVTVP
jgi:hypothetical protein